MKCPICGAPGKFRVTFTAYALGHAKVPGNRIVGNFNLELCESHARSAKKEDLITKSGWEKIQQSLLSQGKALLDSSTIQLDMVPV